MNEPPPEVVAEFEAQLEADAEGLLADYLRAFTGGGGTADDAHHFAEAVAAPAPVPQPLNITFAGPDPKLPGVVRELVDALKNPPAPPPVAEFDVVHERDGEGRIVRSRRVPPKGGR